MFSDTSVKLVEVPADDAKEREVFFDFSVNNLLSKAVVSELTTGEFVFAGCAPKAVGEGVVGEPVASVASMHSAINRQRNIFRVHRLLGQRQILEISECNGTTPVPVFPSLRLSGTGCPL